MDPILQIIRLKFFGPLPDIPDVADATVMSDQQSNSSTLIISNVDTVAGTATRVNH